MPRDPHIEIIARAVVTCGAHALVCRHPPGNYVVFPGGHVDLGETAAEGLARELREEIGLELTVGRCLGVQELLFEQKGRLRHEYTLMFHVEHPPTWDPESPPRLVSPEAPKIELGWIRAANLGSVDLRPAMAGHLLRNRFAGIELPEAGGIAWMPAAAQPPH